jgi:hypothetical protein
MFLPRRVWPAVVLTVLACNADSSGQDQLSRIVSPALSVDAAGPSVSGHGNLTQLPSGANRTFSFHARVMPDGTVQGEYDNHNRQGGFVNHGDIDCIRFIGTNGAVLSGRSTRSTNPLGPEGTVTIFRVEDLGEGADIIDRVSQLLIFAADSPNNCMNFTPPVLLPIEAGNVQVRP